MTIVNAEYEDYERQDVSVNVEDLERRRLLEALADSILKKRNEAVVAKESSGIHERWRQDQDAFDGWDELLRRGSVTDYATGQAYIRANTDPSARSEVGVNIIRGKCETAEGRFSDIQLPTDERNWGLSVTPVPELVTGMKSREMLTHSDTGDPILTTAGKFLTIADKARLLIDEAKDRMKLMENEIDDQLGECGFNGECRKVIKNAIRLGTGILKGPNVIKRIKRSWRRITDGTRTLHVIQAVEEFKPETVSVDPWRVYLDPNCEEDIKKAVYVFERDEILPRQLRNLLGVDGYFDDQIRLVLDEAPIRLSIVSRPQKSSLPETIQRTRVEKGLAYEKWEYHGDVDRDDLEALGCDCSHSEMPSLTACIVFVNDRPIKVVLNPLDTEDLPYDFFQWTQVSGSPWGIGIPRMGIWWQRIVQSAWRAMMDNSGDSSGANIIVGIGVEPDDGIWEIRGKKIWRIVDSDIRDAREAFAQFQITNNQADLQRVVELALRFFDMETSLPMLFQGEQQEMPDTLGATNIVVDANNVALRSRVKTWDDQITRPHIVRYYHWNMQYNEREEIKGDYNVLAKGVSVLLERDQQAKTLLQLLPVRKDPAFSEIDWKKTVKTLMQSLRLDVMKSEDDIRADEEQLASTPPREIPQLQVAQVRSQAELQKAQLVQQSDMAELQFKAQEAETQRQHERQMKEMELNIKIIEFAEKRKMKLEEVKEKLAVEASKQNLMRELTQQKTQAPQLTTPPVEPAPRAGAGRAYQE